MTQSKKRAGHFRDKAKSKSKPRAQKVQNNFTALGCGYQNLYKVLHMPYGTELKNKTAKPRTTGNKERVPTSPSKKETTKEDMQVWNSVHNPS